MCAFIGDNKEHREQENKKRNVIVAALIFRPHNQHIRESENQRITDYEYTNHNKINISL